MKSLYLLAIMLSMASMLAQADNDGKGSDHKNHPKYKHYEAYKNNHNKLNKDNNLDEKRFGNYLKNIEKIESHNKNDEQSFTLGENEFTDWSDDELRQLVGSNSNRKIPHQTRDLSNMWIDDYSVPLYFYAYNSSLKVTTDLNWVTLWNTTVKNQAQCGSCWAFSGIGALEAQFKLKAKKVLDLSEQEIVDCVNADNYANYWSNRCNGGYYGDVFSFAGYKGIGVESEYPYLASGNYSCNLSRLTTKYTIQDYILQQKGGDVKALEQALFLFGPLSFNMDVSSVGNNFYYYKNGTWDGIQDTPTSAMCTTSPNHAMILVGYTSDYWLIKNSWGSSWGMNGYLRLKKNLTVNLCGIANDFGVPRINLSKQTM